MEDRLIKNDTFKINNSESFWNGYEFGAPDQYAAYVDNFLTYVASEWTVTETQAGATEVLTDVAGGGILITNSAADDDLVGMQLGAEAFKPAVDKQIWFQIKFQISDATQSDFYVGLSDTDTGLPTLPSDGIGFHKTDGSTTIGFSAISASIASTEANVGTLANATDIILGFKVTGTHSVEAWVNNFKVADIQTNIPTTEMRLSFALRNGEGVAKTMTVKRIIGVQEL